MDTRRRAPDLGKLEPSLHASAPPSIQTAPPHPTIHSGRDGHALAGQVVRALNANLDRGFLESEAQFRQLADTLHDVVFLTDADLGAIRFINAAYEEIWGRPRAELYENPLAFLEGVHPDDRDRVLDTVTRSPGSGYEVEFRVIRPDGALRWVWTRGFPVRDPNGEVSRIAGIAEDMTDRKQIAASHERLIRGFTHDVKNPLGAADGYLALLEDGVLGELSPLQSESVGRARRSIRTALNLVLQLLDIERAQTGTLELDRQSFEVGHMLRDLLEDYRAAAGEKRLHISLELSDSVGQALTVYSDPIRVRQIVGNLISNAVKYTQPGGHFSVTARLADEGEAPTLRGSIAIEVADNGPGIPLAKQHLLFREFTRFHPEAANGSGIGLAISQQLARALDGSITFRSTPGVGSAFTLWLPRDRRVTSE